MSNPKLNTILLKFLHSNTPRRSNQITIPLHGLYFMKISKTKDVILSTGREPLFISLWCNVRQTDNECVKAAGICPILPKMMKYGGGAVS